jgi:hypothetical protein
MTNFNDVHRINQIGKFHVSITFPMHLGLMFVFFYKVKTNKTIFYVSQIRHR